MSEHAQLLTIYKESRNDAIEIEDALEAGFEVANITVAGEIVYYLMLKPKEG